jgi:hypothetical protein
VAGDEAEVRHDGVDSGALHEVEAAG